VSDTAVAGFSTETVRIPPGERYSEYFTVYAKDVVASVQIKATATGFTEGTSVLIVQTPQLDVSSSNRGYVGGPSINLNLYTEDEAGYNRRVWNDLDVTLTSTNPSVLTLDSSTVTVPSGEYSKQASWTPVSAGTARIIATAPGYDPDTTDLLTVEVPQITLSNVPSTLGVGQNTEYGDVRIPYYVADDDAVVVHLSNSNPAAVSLSVDSVLILPGSNYGRFTVVGVALGTTEIQASADEFTSSEIATVEVGTPLLHLDGSQTGTSGSGGYFYVYAQDQTGVDRTVNEDLTVTLNIDNTAVADFGQAGQSQTTLVITRGSSYGYVYVWYRSAGSVTVTATATGYEEDPPGGIAITVSEP
jgi:hypothetical protein